MTTRRIQIILTPPGISPPTNQPPITPAQHRLANALGPIGRCIALRHNPQPIRPHEVRRLLRDHLQHNADKISDSPPAT